MGVLSALRIDAAFACIRSAGMAAIVARRFFAAATERESSALLRAALREGSATKSESNDMDNTEPKMHT